MFNASDFPLCVDLDGTLIRNDLVWESLCQFIKEHPFQIFLILFWSFRGLAFLKTKMTAALFIEPEHLVYNKDLVNFLKTEHQRGVLLYLITGSPQHYADAVANHMGFFQEAFGTQENLNLVSENKTTLLDEKFGSKKYIYIGNSSSDISVWKHSEKIIIVNPPASVLRTIKKWNKPFLLFEDILQTSLLKNLIKASRVHQWIKNFLIFLPLILNRPQNFWTILHFYILGFISLCFMCSAVYIANDLCDLTDDRKHPTKRNRPLAHGDIHIPHAFIYLSLLVILSLILASLLGIYMILVLLGYAIANIIYSFKIKSIPFLDVLCLAGFYVYRIFIGCRIGQVEESTWILGFSFFLFLSLALMKRYVEIKKTGGNQRGYCKEDIHLVHLSGVIFSHLSLVIFTLYIESPQSLVTFAHPRILWMIVPSLAYGLLRFWHMAERGSMNDDPILFLLKDIPIRWTLLYSSVCFMLAAYPF